MGKGNATVKQWLGNPRRFADLFNGIVFQGKQVILPEDLHLATGETDILVSDKNKKQKRYNGIGISSCDGNRGHTWCYWHVRIRRMYIFLSQFRKADKLVPVITLVFYYHPDAWDGSLDLHGILRWSDDEAKNKILQKYVSNYRINLVDAGNIKELENFHTDLQEIFGMLQCRQNKVQLLNYVKSKEQYFRHLDEETYQVLQEFLQSERILKQEIKKEEGEEQIDMCKALEDLYQDGIEQGIESGIERGAVETYQEMGVSKEEVVERIQNRFSLLTKEAEAVVEKYWKE